MNRTVLSLAAVLFFSVLMTTSCIAPIQPETPPPDDGNSATVEVSEALSTDSLANMTYISQYGSDGTVTLENGEFSEPAAPGSASMNSVMLAPEYTAYGTLNDEPAAAVILISSGGGSGTFYDLAIVLEEDGQPVNVATTLLGDRIELNSVTIQDNQIIVDMIAAGPGDAACCPTHRYRNVYELQGDQIVEVSSDMLGQVESDVDSEQNVTLEGTNWQLVSFVNVNGDEVVALPDVKAMIRFEDGSVGGNVGCNSFSGAYTVQDDQIEVGPIASTLMACLEPLMAQEEGVQIALGEASTFAIAEDTLQLYDSDGNVVATFVKAPEVSLTGLTWSATAYNNGRGGVTSLIIGTEITAIFGEDGMMSGSAGCNNYSASYMVDGSAIEIGPAASTRMLCAEPEGVMQQEQEYLAALSTAAVYRIDVDTLELRTDDGALVATYQVISESEADDETAVDEDETLVGADWKWQRSLYNNDTESVPSDPSQYTVQFADDGSLAVQADCNRGNGAFTVTDSSITIEVMAMTEMMCPEGSLDQDFLRDLNAAVIYFFQDGELFLDMKYDTGTMRFAK